MLPRKHSSWWRRLEDVFHLRLQRRRPQDLFKTSWWRRIYSPYSYILRRRPQEVLIKTNLFVLVIRLQDVFKMFSRHLQDIFKISSRHLQDVLDTSSRRLQDIFKTSARRFENIFKKSSRHLQDVLQRCLQDVFKTYYEVKLFLVTQFQGVFEKYSKRFRDILLRRLSTESLPRSHFWEIYGQCTKFPIVINISQLLAFHFATPFSGCLQKRI